MHVLRGVIIHKSMSQSEFYIFQKKKKEGTFLLFFCQQQPAAED